VTSTLAHWNVAFRDLWSQLMGIERRPLPAFEDEARQRFDREYEAILAEMAASMAAMQGPREVARWQWRSVERRRYARSA
jgi:hypothetical protein